MVLTYMSEMDEAVEGWPGEHEIENLDYACGIHEGRYCVPFDDAERKRVVAEFLRANAGNDPEKRREAHIIGYTDADAHTMDMFGWWNLKDASAYDQLLAFFDKTEPELANAIRYGLDGPVLITDQADASQNGLHYRIRSATK